MSYLDSEKKIIPVNSFFSFYALEIFYDEKKMKKIQLDNNNDFMNKKVESNGIHCALFEKDNENKNKKQMNSLGNVYVISEKYQIFPIYTLTLKRNEICVLFRDPNFNGNNPYTDYLKQIKQISTEIENKNIKIYYENSTEEALKFLVKRKYDKVILITSIGKDLSGKRFIEIARKIFGFDIIVLFFSKNSEHLPWIQQFPNCLYTTNLSIYKQYILNHTEQGLKKLKTIDEEKYKIKLMPFTKCLSYPNYKSEGNFSSLDFTSPYIRHVHIKNGNIHICMDFYGKVYGSEEEGFPWDITIFEDEITMLSNEYYLDIDKNKEIAVGAQYMKRWKFVKENENYYFINIEKKINNILSMEGKNIKVNKDKPGQNELFQLIDIYDEY